MLFAFEFFGLFFGLLFLSMNALNSFKSKLISLPSEGFLDSIRAWAGSGAQARSHSG